MAKQLLQLLCFSKQRLLGNINDNISLLSVEYGLVIDYITRYTMDIVVIYPMHQNTGAANAIALI